VAAVGGRVHVDRNSVLRAEVPLATVADGL
jgi:hypothetical protein